MREDIQLIKEALTCYAIAEQKAMADALSDIKPLSEDFTEAKKQILNAIRNGNNTVINRNVSNTIPNIEITNSLKTAHSGEVLNLDKKTYLNVEVNKKALIKVILNGRELYECIAKKCNILLTKLGKYRVEILIDNKEFAYTNPIVVM